MKVLYITPPHDPKTGWGRYSIEVLKEAARQDIAHDVCIVHSHSFWEILKACLVARKKAQHVDVVHALDGWPFGVIGYAAVIGTTKKLFVSGVGTYTTAHLGGFLKETLRRIVYRRVTAILCISRYTQKIVQERFPAIKTTVIFLGASAFPQPAVGTGEQYHLHGKPVILTVGAIKHRKGQLDTLKAVALVQKTYPDAIYLMVGSRTDDPRYVHDIEMWAKAHALEKHIRIISDGPEDEALAYFYTQADVFVLNANNTGEHFEGFGLVFLEAYQFGVPGVGSRNCGIEDAISDGVSGYLSEQGNHADIAEKIIKTLERRDVLSKGAHTFREKFSWEKTVREYLTVYEGRS